MRPAGTPVPGRSIGSPRRRARGPRRRRARAGGVEALLGPVRSLPADTCASRLRAFITIFGLRLFAWSVRRSGRGGPTSVWASTSSRRSRRTSASATRATVRGRLLGRDLRLVAPERAPEQPHACPRAVRRSRPCARAARGRGSRRAARPTTADGVVQQLAAPRSRLLVGSSSSVTGGAAAAGRPARQHRLAAGQLPTRRSRSPWAARARPSAATARSSTSQSSPTSAKSRGGVARLDCAQRLPLRRRRPAGRPPGVGVQGEVLRQVADLAGDAHRARRGPQLTGDQPQQGGLARAVRPDQPGAARAEGDVEVGEHAVAVGPGEGQLGTDDGGSRHRTPHGSTTAGPRCRSPRVNRKGRVVGAETGYPST